jgi:hypothetical protein
MNPRHPIGLRGLPLLAMLVATGCQTEPTFTPLEQKYHLTVGTTRTSYARSDSVFVRVVNADAFPYVWHRCPGVVLEQKEASGWTEISSGDCIQGSVPLPGNQAITITFVVPLTAPAGQYRVRISLSAIDGSTPIFYWPSSEFAVTGP